MKIELGGGNNPTEGYLNIDNIESADIHFNLNNCGPVNQLPFAMDSITHIKAAHVLEHIDNILPLMEELYRVAAPDCEFEIVVPHAWSNAALEDPTHVRQFLPLSFAMFGQPAYKRADYGYRGDWSVDSVIVLVEQGLAEAFTDNGIGIEFAVQHLINVVLEMHVTMKACKPRRDVSAEYDHPHLEIQLANVEEG